jgi:actin-related protein 6
LDSGFSFTHAVPVAGGREVTVAARRLNVGGKALTNHLKETVSFRSWNMMDETAVVNAAKERLCFVSMDYMRDLAVTQMEPCSPIRREYVLPDLSRSGVDPLGHVRGEEEMDGTEQILAMHNERISVPEVLFNPLDVGLPQAGIAELVVQAIEACSARYRADLYANVVLAGGNCCFPNFRQRLVDELRPLVPDIYKLSVSVEEKPILSAFRGGVLALQNPEAKLLNFVTKAEYEEHGSNITLDRFRC